MDSPNPIPKPGPLPELDLSVSSGSKQDPHGPPPSAESESVPRSLDQVLDIGLHALQQSLLELDGSDLDFDALEEVMETTEQAMALSAERRSIEDAIPVPLETVPLRTESSELELSLEDLLAQVAELERSVAAPLTLGGVDARDEELSIVLSMLLASDLSFRADWVGDRLRASIRSAISTDSRTLWWRTVRDFMDVADHQVLDLIFPLIARTLRFARPPLVDQLVVAARNTSEVAHESIWPHAANELLIARRRRGDKTPRGLREIVARQPSNENRSLERLSKLQALASDDVARDAFNPRIKSLYPFFERLLRSVHAPKVGQAVLSGLRMAPIDEDWAVVFQVMRTYRSSQAWFLRRILLERGAPASRELEEEAAVQLTCALAELPDDQRDEPWIPGALYWLGRGYFPAAVGLLEEVVNARKRPFVRAWSADCRRAAKEALKLLRSGGGKE